MNLILMAIGDDRPGLVEQLSAAIGRHGGNWLQSSMSHLSDKFVGIVRVNIGEDRVDALRAELAELSGFQARIFDEQTGDVLQTELAAQPGLRVTAEVTGVAPAPSGRRLNLTLVGHDRIGIVREVSHVLARHAVNVEELSTHTASAPMSAGILFHATAELTVSPLLDTRALVRDLEQISDELMVDITLDELIR